MVWVFINDIKPLSCYWRTGVWIEKTGVIGLTKKPSRSYAAKKPGSEAPPASQHVPYKNSHVGLGDTECHTHVLKGSQQTGDTRIFKKSLGGRKLFFV